MKLEEDVFGPVCIAGVVWCKNDPEDFEWRLKIQKNVQRNIEINVLNIFKTQP